MQALRRILLTSVTILSLTLCLAVVAVRVRQIRITEIIAYRFGRAADGSVSEWRVGSGEAGIGLYVARHSPNSEDKRLRGWSRRGASGYAAFGSPSIRRSIPLGFALVSESYRGVDQSGFVAPHWFYLVVFAVVPVLRLRDRLRRRAAPEGVPCPRCGYDLRATPGRCPECGVVVGESSGS
jgi:hypothetical protein